MKSYDRIYMGGEWKAPSSGERIAVINPATEDVCAHVPAAKAADIDAAVAAAREAFDAGPWPTLPLAERLAWMRKLSQALGNRRDELTTTITTELGCPVSTSMMAQAFPPTMVLDKYAEIAETFQLSRSTQRVHVAAIRFLYSRRFS